MSIFESLFDHTDIYYTVPPDPYLPGNREYKHSVYKLEVIRIRTRNLKHLSQLLPPRSLVQSKVYYYGIPKRLMNWLKSFKTEVLSS